MPWPRISIAFPTSSFAMPSIFRDSSIDTSYNHMERGHQDLHDGQCRKTRVPHPGGHRGNISSCPQVEEPPRPQLDGGSQPACMTNLCVPRHDLGRWTTWSPSPGNITLHSLWGYTTILEVQTYPQAGSRRLNGMESHRPGSLGSGHGGVLMGVVLKTDVPLSMVQVADRGGRPKGKLGVGSG
jgi:hypothetical protein